MNHPTDHWYKGRVYYLQDGSYTPTTSGGINDKDIE